MKYFAAFVMFLIPIFVVIAVLRVPTTGSFNVPTAVEMLNQMNRIGSNDDLLAAINNFRASGNDISNIQVVDLGSFFSAIGKFFETIGNFFGIIFQIIAVPFRFLGWLIGLI